MKIAYRSPFLFLIVALTIVAPIAVRSQSTDQNFPTAITGPEIRGSIKARDVGDSRLTSYFYELHGEQGDVFINVVTRNFNGDIDIFDYDGLKPLSKIVIYSSGGVDETGRIVYLRKPERMLLRIEGRTPGDDPASFTIKFAGSFVAMRPTRTRGDASTEPTVATDLGGVKLSSSGAVIPGSTNRGKSAADAAPSVSTHNETGNAPNKPGKVRTDEALNDKISTQQAMPEQNVPETREGEAAKPHFEAIDTKRKAADETVEGSTSTEKKPDSTATRSDGQNTRRTDPARKPPDPNARKAGDASVKADPLALATLVVTMKNGTSFEKPMKDVLRFSAEKGVLYIVAKGGSIVRYMLVDIANISIR